MSGQRTKVDRLAVSIRDDHEAVRGFFAGLYGHIGVPAYDVRRGAHGFQSAAVVTIGGAQVGWWGWGGASQKGRSYVDVTGLGCQLLPDWRIAQDAVQSLPDVRAKRIDIAADFYHGEVTYEATLDAYRAGKFARDGRPPSMRQILPGDADEGRTLYVGKRGNDVFFRAYEKGKKEFQGLPSCSMRHGLSAISGRTDEGESFAWGDWVRLELELRGTKRPLPLDVIAQRDQYFAGAYPYLQEVLPDVTAEILVRPETVISGEMMRALEQVRRQYGGTLFTALTVAQGDVFEIWKRICGHSHNDRLVKAGVLLLDHFASETQVH